ncbi:MAG: thiamine biosynthesis lipoprotein [Paraglaciecola sp.]|jgi:thiamine biosynthesis lipoprotein
MGSPCVLHLYCSSAQHFDNAVAQSIAKIKKLEDQYSRYSGDSLLSEINRNAGSKKRFKLSDEFWTLLQYANTAYSVSDGLFDITSGVLRKVWDFKSRKAPELDKIDSILKRVGWSKIVLDKDRFYLPIVGMEMDLGGIVKEYAADLVAETLRHYGLQHGLVDMGGDIALVGPHPDNNPWQVAISDPDGPSKAIATIPLMGGGLASSGDYQRFIVLNDEKYTHILNPKTGWPVKGLTAVSVWAPQCVVAGTLATIAMLKGEVEGKQWLQDVGCNYLTVDRSGRVNLSS